MDRYFNQGVLFLNLNFKLKDNQCKFGSFKLNAINLLTHDLKVRKENL